MKFPCLENKSVQNLCNLLYKIKLLEQLIRGHTYLINKIKNNYTYFNIINI